MRCVEDPKRAMSGRRGASCRAAACAAVLLAVSGCTTVGPKFATPHTAVRDGWRTNGSSQLVSRAPADTRWWMQFDDRVLDRLVDLAYRQNLTLQVAGLRIVESRARLAFATGLKWPQVQVAQGSVTGVGLSRNAPNTSNLPGLDRHYVDYQVGFDAVWELDFWGKYRRGVESEAATLLATVADYQSALVTLTAEVARTYVAIRTLEVLIDEAQANVKVQEQGLLIAQSRFQNGATSELDVIQATTLLESTRATIPQLQGSLQQARNALSTLLGQPTGTVEELLEGRRGIPGPPAQVAVSVPAEMLRRRPDIRAAELAAAAQCARIGVAKADLYPSFTLFGTLGFQASTAGGGNHRLLSGDNVFYNIGPRISWPFFNYGRIENSVRIEDARFQQLLVGYREAVLRAAQEVDDAIAGFLNAQEAAAAQERSVVSARRAVELAFVQYREGATDFQRVLDAERSLLAQQNALTQSSSSVTTNVIALFKALGGGWEWAQGEAILPAGTIDEMKARTNWGDLLSQPARQEAKESPQSVKQ